MNIEVYNNTDDVIDEIDNLKEYLINISKDEGLDNVLFNVIIVDNEKIRELNKMYRNIDKETDVITFALEDDKMLTFEMIRILGDIYISLDKVKEQSIAYKHSFKRELYFLATHGFFHLLGYDHMVKKDEIEMFNKQEEALLKYGITR